MDREADGERVQKVPDASRLQADACEIEALGEAGLAECDVVVAATGDDKVNLVLAPRQDRVRRPANGGS